MPVKKIQKRIAVIALVLGAVVLVGLGYFIYSKQQSSTKILTVGKETVENLHQKIKNKVSSGAEVEIPKGVPSSQAKSKDQVIPKYIPDEFLYPGVSVGAIQQIAGKGIVLILVSPDSQGQVGSRIARQVRLAGWELIDGSDKHLTLKKGQQKAKVSVDSQDSQTILIIALTYDKK